MVTPHLHDTINGMGAPSQWIACLVLVGASALGGCVLAEIDYRDKRCPCPTGWSCDPATDRCFETNLQGDGAVKVGNLLAAWATPNTIRWEWQASGIADQLL